MIKDVILIMDVCWIGRNLHALREKNKLTQEKLGKEVALSAFAISNIENSLSFPSIILRYITVDP